MNHGRWTEEEKKIYNKYILEYKNTANPYKFISFHIKTRTVVQIRTHHQKEFQKKLNFASILLKLSKL